MGVEVSAILETSVWYREGTDTRVEELGEMLATGQTLTKALFQPNINRSEYTIMGLNKLLARGGIIASVHIDAGSGLVRGSGVMHWLALIRVIPERNGQGNGAVLQPRYELYGELFLE